ncbi:amidase [Prosthecobacter fusiformis]|uniref:Amidase n=1 Tax=Prosthecobacter fusiformis TaxID=48464 RepID=A0A4R7RKC2_9BACT|nr:amidase [Prosthecobacter fusiformis]TDU63083.1 amidase [Prosthecobacter fusiformis]
MINRRVFIGSGLAVLTGCRRDEAIPSGQQFTIAELSQQIHQGSLSADSVLKHYLHRIKTLDQSGPRLRSIIELNPDVGAATGKGPLQGIPILIKDNIETADAMETTAGSLALLGAPKPKQDATVVKRLRQAGATLLGKTNLSEWANIRSPNSTSGWSARGGLTMNPHNLAHSASGSSSGSAVAVAAGLCAAAIGTETNGSIVSPASACGIVGLKPTVGLISRAGIIPITRWQDTPGPMTQTVWDAALLLNVLAGKDDRDPYTAKAQVENDYTFNLIPDGLKGKRLGVLHSHSGKNRKVKKLFAQTLEKLSAAGAILVEGVTIPHHRESDSAAWVAMLTEFRQDLNQYLAGRGGVVKSLAELIAYNEEFREQEMVHFNQEFFIEAETRGTPEHLAKAEELRKLALRLAGPEGLDAALKKDSLDALICPTNDPSGRIDLGMGDANDRVFGSTAAVSGYPHLTVPMGMVADLPIGLSFIGSAWSEALLLQLGHAYEQVREFEPVKLFG